MILFHKIFSPCREPDPKRKHNHKNNTMSDILTNTWLNASKRAMYETLPTAALPTTVHKVLLQTRAGDWVVASLARHHCGGRGEGPFPDFESEPPPVLPHSRTALRLPQNQETTMIVRSTCLLQERCSPRRLCKCMQLLCCALWRHLYTSKRQERTDRDSTWT